MKDYISRINNRQLSHVLATYMCMTLSLFYLEVVTYEGTPSFLFRIIAAIADATLIVLPFTFLKRCGNVALAIVSAVLSLLMLANVLYYRCFGDLIPGSSYFGSSLTSSFVIKGAIAALRFGDALLLVTGLLPLVLWAFIRNEFESADKGAEICADAGIMPFVDVLACRSLQAREHLFGQFSVCRCDGADLSRVFGRLEKILQQHQFFGLCSALCAAGNA